MEFQGAINLFRPTGTTTNHITVNNNTTFSGGWTTCRRCRHARRNNTGVVFRWHRFGDFVDDRRGQFQCDASRPLTADGITVNFNGVNPE